MSCTARIGRGCAVRFATFRQRCRYGGARCTRGEDYDVRVANPRNVYDNRRIAVSRVAARRRHRRERECEDDLGQPAAES